VPHYAMSGGTLIALAADEIVMDPHAVLGPIDPQIGQFPAASILKVLEQKDANEVDDQTLILADISRKALQQALALVKNVLMVNGMDAARAHRWQTNSRRATTRTTTPSQQVCCSRWG
jgi:Periplasmic serine proteases (ClpP class)